MKHWNLPSLFFLLRAFLRAPAIFNILRPNLPVLSRKPRSRISLARGTSTIHPNTTNIIKSTSLEDAVGGYILLRYSRGPLEYPLSQSNTRGVHVHSGWEGMVEIPSLLFLCSRCSTGCSASGDPSLNYWSKARAICWAIPVLGGKLCTRHFRDCSFKWRVSVSDVRNGRVLASKRVQGGFEMIVSVYDTAARI